MELFKNDKPEVENTKLTIYVSMPKKDWDGIKPSWFYSGGGFDQKQIKKKQVGEDLQLTFDLGPGQ